MKISFYNSINNDPKWYNSIAFLPLIAYFSRNRNGAKEIYIQWIVWGLVIELNTPKSVPLTGAEMIAQEREEQLTKHGRTVVADMLFNTRGQLIYGAMALLAKDTESNIYYFPVEWDGRICKKMYEKPYKERLIIAGALIAAELDRLEATKGINPKQ